VLVTVILAAVVAVAASSTPAVVSPTPPTVIKSVIRESREKVSVDTCIASCCACC
jgi:hypothetical protein